jgi:MoaA/NifB/PqqE/SkfB family radical SAM enzyme
MNEIIFLVLELGDKCNNNCVFCSVKQGLRQNLSTKAAEQTINSYYKKGFRKIQFSGGEPLIRKDIVHLVDYAKKTGYSIIGLSTNGRLFAYDILVKKVIDAGCNSFAISLHSHDENIHNACTRTPGSFDQTVQGIKHVLAFKKEKDLHVKINFVMNKLNMPYLRETVKWFNKEFKGLGMINLINMHPVGTAAGKPFLMYKISDYKEAIDSALENKEIDVQLDDFPFCAIENNKLIWEKKGDYISSYSGKVNLADSLSCLKTKFEFCNSCVFDKQCKGIWKKYAEQFGTGEFKPVLE